MKEPQKEVMHGFSLKEYNRNIFKNQNLYGNYLEHPHVIKKCESEAGMKWEMEKE